MDMVLSLFSDLNVKVGDPHSNQSRSSVNACIGEIMGNAFDLVFMHRRFIPD